MPNREGDYVWYELLTSDPDAAQRYYADVIGWKVRDSGMPDMDYRLISAPDGADVAGIMKLPAGAPMPPAWLGYVGVDDTDAKVAAAEGLGARVYMPATDIPGVGRFAMLADPQGVVFYIMRGSSDQRSTAFKPAAKGHAVWNELVTSDQAAGIEFYSRMFGWQKGDAMPMGEMGDYRFLNHHGEMLGAAMNNPPGGSPPRWNYYFRVGDIDAAAERVRAGGGQVAFGPMEVPGGDWVVNGIDPQGAAFGIVGSRV